MNRLTRRSGTLIAAALAIAIPVDGASAKITHTSVAGIHLGKDESGLRDVLGPPSSIGDTDYGDAREFVFKRHKLSAILLDDAVVLLRTSSASERTREGVGPGTSLRTMVRRVTGERCSSVRHQRVCSVRHGRTAMTFIGRGSRVAAVEIATLP